MLKRNTSEVEKKKVGGGKERALEESTIATSIIRKCIGLEEEFGPN